MTILAELGVVAMKRAPVQPLPQSFDRRSRQQLEIAKRREFGRRDDMWTGHRESLDRDSCLGRTASSRRATIALGVDALGLGLEVDQHAMTQHGRRHRANVVERHRGAADAARPALCRRAAAPARRAARRPSAPTAARNPAPRRTSPAATARPHQPRWRSR